MIFKNQIKCLKFKIVKKISDSSSSRQYSDPHNDACVNKIKCHGKFTLTCGFTKKVKSLPFWSTTSSCHGIASPLSGPDLSQKYRPQCNNDWSPPAAGVHQVEHQAVHVRGQAAQTKIRYASATKKIKIRSYVFHAAAAAIFCLIMST